MTPIEQRAKRILETALGDRVMLPQFGSRLFELVDKPISSEYRLRFISYAFEAFWNTTNGRLWDAELEPKQIVFCQVNNDQIETTLILTSGEEIGL